MKKLLVFSLIAWALVYVTQQPALGQRPSSAPASGDEKAVEPRLYFRKSGREIPNSRLSIKEGKLPNPYAFKALYFVIENVDVNGLEIISSAWGPENKTLQMIVKNTGVAETRVAHLALVIFSIKTFPELWKHPINPNETLFDSKAIPKLKPGGEISVSLKVFDLKTPLSGASPLMKSILGDPKEWEVTLRCVLVSDLIDIK